MAKHKRYRGKTDYRIVWEDSHIIVVNKPPGLLTVPIPKIQSLNLQDLLNKKYDFKNKNIRAAHRIDRYTSGLVVFARHKKAHDNLVAQFKSQTPHRAYLALVRGTPKPAEGELVNYMRRVKQGFRNVVVKKGNPKAGRARLEYVTLEQAGEISLVKIKLDTGLKNQIRVQFAEFGHPLVGDRHYSKDEIEEPGIDRQALHAAELAFQHPMKDELSSHTAPLAKDILGVLDRYRTR